MKNNQKKRFKKINWNKFIGISITVISLIIFAIMYIFFSESRILIAMLSGMLSLINITDKLFPPQNKEMKEIQEKLDLLIRHSEEREEKKLRIIKFNFKK